MRRLIADLDALLGGSLLVGCTKELEEKLIEEGAIGGGRSMHFGAERGHELGRGAARACS